MSSSFRIWGLGPDRGVGKNFNFNFHFDPGTAGFRLLCLFLFPGLRWVGGPPGLLPGCAPLEGFVFEECERHAVSFGRRQLKGSPVGTLKSRTGDCGAKSCKMFTKFS